MAARTPIVASELEAFKRVLGGGVAGQLFPIGDSAALAGELDRVLDDAALRRRLVEAAARAVIPYDWTTVVKEVLRVYELAIAGASAPLDRPRRGPR
jgi:phosphatidylinositol alpha-mannosyltransferase